MTDWRLSITSQFIRTQTAKMDYKCRNCEKEFEQIGDAVRHLKINHKIVEHSERISCIVNFPNSNYCKRSYLTINGLKTHVQSCVKTKHKLDENTVRINTPQNSMKRCLYRVLLHIILSVVLYSE